MTPRPITLCRCGTPRLYCEEHDSYYCQPCDIWLESRCERGGYAPCSFCDARPVKPSMVVGRGPAGSNA